MANKFLFSFLILVLTLSVSGQGIRLENLIVSQKESKIIYIGIENKFKVTDFKNLLKVEPNSGFFSLKEDILILKPTQVGSLTLNFHTTEGIQPVTFDIRVISDLIPAIGNLTNKVVDKQAVITQAKVNLHSFNTQEIYFDNYKVTSFEAHLNNHVFSIQGDQFTNELLRAISQSRSGDKLVLANVKVANVAIGRTGQLQSRFDYELK